MFPNFYQIVFDFDLFQVQRLPYDIVLFEKLRINYVDTHSFFRNDEFIYLCPFNDQTDLIGEIITLSVEKDIRIVGTMIKHLFFRAFTSGYPEIRPRSFYPFKFKSRNPKHDLAIDLLPDYLKGKISYIKETEVQVRNIKFNDKLTWGIVINNDYRWEFNINTLELSKEGFDIVGLEVLQRQEKLLESGTYSEQYHLLGTVARIFDNIAIVDTNKGSNQIKQDQLRLHKSKEILKKYIDFKLGSEKSEQVFAKIAQREIKNHNAKQNFNDINATAKVLATLFYQNTDGFIFRIKSDADGFYEITQQKAPTLVYSYDGYKTHSNADSGLNQFGPYDSMTFEVKRPKILVVCHRLNRGTFATFLAKFRSGIPNSSWYKSGFLAKYHLHQIDFVIEEIADYSVSAYEETIRAVFRKTADESFSIALIETKAEWRSYLTARNPYYQVYAYLLSLGIPIQWITNENVRKPDQYLDSILNSIALQMYAKMGGTPWVLPANANIDRELVIGIGSSVIKTNNFKDAEQLKVIGITTFFSSDGRYLFGNKSRDVSYNQYFEELLYNIDSSFQEISKRDGWQNGETIRIVFHIFKSVKNQEVKVIEKLILRFPQYNIKFAFVTVSDDHPFWLFEPNEEGVIVGQDLKGQFVPRRGQTLVLNEHSCLVQMKGPKQLKTFKQGVSRPLLINIHKESTFKDLFYISQQVFSFSNLSWRGFLPLQQPVTIYYSDLIANKLAHLREIVGWRPEVINGPIKFKKWFL